jgi:pimeloyl-ACP methyl ester carboxylesterase
VLDSPVPVDGLDAMGALRLLSAPRVLREACAGLCRRTVPDPVAALRTAVKRLPLTATAVSRSGRRTRVRITEYDLYAALAAIDGDPGVRAGLPAAIASLAAGDATPLVHLFAVGPTGAGRAINGARFLATTCTEGRLPWDPESPVASRGDAIRAFIDEHAATFAPFSAETALGYSNVATCEDWPPTPRPEPVALQGPDVPVLVLSGRADVRTPLEDARRTAAQYPNATLLAVPGVGHSVVRSDPSGCARAGLVAFLRGGSVSACRGPERRAAPFAPATIGALRPTRLAGRPGRTLSAIAVTLAGIAFDAAARGRETFRLPGLRGGYVRATRRTLELHDVVWIRGVRVSGRLDARGRGTVTVRGPKAARGTVTYRRGGASGTLGGRSFTL